MGHTFKERKWQFLKDTFVTLGICLKGILTKKPGNEMDGLKSGFYRDAFIPCFTTEGGGTWSFYHCCLGFFLASLFLHSSWVGEAGGRAQCLPKPCRAWKLSDSPVTSFLQL